MGFTAARHLQPVGSRRLLSPQSPVAIRNKLPRLNNGKGTCVANAQVWEKRKGIKVGFVIVEFYIFCHCNVAWLLIVVVIAVNTVK